jgi:hypothetical protein
MIMLQNSLGIIYMEPQNKRDKDVRWDKKIKDKNVSNGKPSQSVFARAMLSTYTDTHLGLW